MNGACLKESLVYYDTISSNNKNYKSKLYKAVYKTSFSKYGNQKKLLNLVKLNLKYLNLNIIKLPPNFKTLYLAEKLDEILDDQDENLLNERSNIITQCHQKKMYRLKTLASSIKSRDIT